MSDRQNCGNLLAGVAPFAIERGLAGGYPVRIHMVNSGEIAVATEAEPGTYILEFPAAGELLPTGNVRDVIDGIEVTCVNAGMPVVVVAARDLGRTGYETIAELEADEDLARRVRSLRLAAGRLWGSATSAGRQSRRSRSSPRRSPAASSAPGRSFPSGCTSPSAYSARSASPARC